MVAHEGIHGSEGNWIGSRGGGIWDTESAADPSRLPGFTWRPWGRRAVGWLMNEGQEPGATPDPEREAANIPPRRVAQTTFSVIDPSSALLLMPPPSLPGGLTEPHHHKSLP